MTRADDVVSCRMTPSGRWAWAEVDLDAIAANVRMVRSHVAPTAVWAVVKADGYGHGAVAVARTALAAGAEGLCVALVQEGVELRQASIEAPILVLSQQPDDTLRDLVANDLTATVYSQAAIRALAEAVRAAGRTNHPVHLKIDSGMHRVGAAPADVAPLVGAVAEFTELRLDGVFTHLAVADVPTHEANARQLDVFDTAVGDALAAVPKRADIHIHAANSAAALALPSARRSFVRMGIAMYGVVPGPELLAAGSAAIAKGGNPGDGDSGSARAESSAESAARSAAIVCGLLRPAMTLRARVSHVKMLPAGAAVSYGLRHRLDRATHVATVPIGYADGVPRGLFAAGGEVLVGGRRRRIIGVVTMDQLMFSAGEPGGSEVGEPGVSEVGLPGPVSIGDEVVLIGRQGDEEIRAEEWAQRLGTIGYEIICGISSRIERRYVGGAAPGL